MNKAELGLVILLISCLVGFVVFYFYQVNDCYNRSCKSGEPVFFYREIKCICAEVPK